MTEAAGRGRIDFVRWRSDSPSGGNLYDNELAAALRSQGVDLSEHDLAGPWPCPEPDDHKRFAAVLEAGNDWLVDNIVGSAAPEVIRSATAAERRITLLMHYFPSDDPALSSGHRQRLAATEAEAVQAASNVVVTSEWAAAEVSARYGRHDAEVAHPGVQPAEIAPGSVRDGGAPVLLWLARLTAQKDPLTFVDALNSLRDLEWTAQLVGPITDRDVSEEVHRRIAGAGLADRIDVPGPQTDDALKATWARTDLLVHTSRSETYGMVVSEALARGIPSVVATGTGAVEAQRVGSTFPRGDAAALADVLRTWLTDPQLRDRWRSEATHHRAYLPTWMDAARTIASTLA